MPAHINSFHENPFVFFKNNLKEEKFVTPNSKPQENVTQPKCSVNAKTTSTRQGSSTLRLVLPQKCCFLTPKTLCLSEGKLATCRLQANKRKLLALFSLRMTMPVSIWGFTKSRKWRCCQTSKAKSGLWLMRKQELSSKQHHWFM